MSKDKLNTKALESLTKILWAMHKLIYPGEYGLGDNLSDKEAFEQLGNLVDKALGLVHGQE